jgi:hypothetical protein
MFCRETVKDLRRTYEREIAYPRPLFFHMGSPAQGADFFKMRWPGAASVSDPDRAFYQAFDIERARLSRLLGPRSWIPSIRALLKGNGMGRPVGDVQVMPGVFLVHGDLILWSHTFSGPGDHPEWVAIPKDAEAYRANSNG